jgi:hypothetical protein
LISQQTLQRLIIVKNKGKINHTLQIHTLILKICNTNYINNNFDEDTFFNKLISIYFKILVKE